MAVGALILARARAEAPREASKAKTSVYILKEQREQLARQGGNSPCKKVWQPESAEQAQGIPIKQLRERDRTKKQAWAPECRVQELECFGLVWGVWRML